MSSTFIIDNRTGNAFAYVLLSSAQASTFHANHITLEASAIAAEAKSTTEDYIIRTHYDIVPKRTIDDFLKAHQEDMTRHPRRQYVDVDLPMTTQELLYALIEAIQEELDERKWDELLARPVVKGTPMWEIQERAKDDIRAGRVKEWKPGESFEALFQ
jgi:hypothetical protein